MVHKREKREKYIKRRKRKVTSLKLTTITSVYSPTSIKSSSVQLLSMFLELQVKKCFYNYKLTITSKGEND